MILYVDIVAPDEELVKTGECYATLSREIDLPFTPFVGLVIGLDPSVPDGQEEKFDQLMGQIESKGSQFTVKKVIYYMERPYSVARFVVYVQNLWEPTLESFHAVQEYLVGFLGFEKEV